MIISFGVENWMSFRDKTTFVMTASKERQHGDRVPQVRKYQTRVLPIAAIYGGNASGKTNLFKALNFAKSLVVKGTPPDSMIAVEGFRLDSDDFDRASRFSFELLIGEEIYDFSFAVTRKSVVEEKMVRVSSASEKVLYSRRDGKPNFDSFLDKDQFLHFAFKGTRSNQLLLNNSVSQGINTFRPVYDWFKDTLELVAPDSRFATFEQFFDVDHPLYSIMNEMLPALDTGIAHLGGEDISFDNIPLPDSVKFRLQEDVNEGESVRLLAETLNERFMVTRKNGELLAKKLITFHPRKDGTEAKFEMRHESDGSQRIIDLLPAFLDLSVEGSNKVYVIDELDRSLHTLLTRKLLSMYLETCTEETRSQLLLTTHDVLLMDQQLLRRDEMWVVERDATGASTLRPISDFKDVRYDKDIRKSYLQGRMGGIPHIAPQRLKKMILAVCEDKRGD